ncbi:ANK1, partial [Symbiodinium sp. CCMP2456]
MPGFPWLALVSAALAELQDADRALLKELRQLSDLRRPWPWPKGDPVHTPGEEDWLDLEQLWKRGEGRHLQSNRSRTAARARHVHALEWLVRVHWDHPRRQEL